MAPAPDVHLLRSQLAGILTTRCDQTRPRPPHHPFPADITAWESLVTCPACQTGLAGS